MANIHFACIAQDTDTKVNMLVFEGGKIIERVTELHDHTAADEYAKKNYGMPLTVGECYENYNAYRASRYGMR